MPSIGEQRYIEWAASIKTRGGSVTRWPSTPGNAQLDKYKGQLAARLSGPGTATPQTKPPFAYELAPALVRDWDNAIRGAENLMATAGLKVATIAESAAKGVLAAPRRLLAGVFGISEGTVTLVALGVAGYWIYKTFFRDSSHSHG